MKLTLGYALMTIYMWSSEVAAAFVNRTIDDQLGDPTTGLRAIYTPGDIWNNQVTCEPNCAIRPKAAYAFDDTYTTTVYRPNSTGSLGISMQFTGIAIYVFFTLANNQTKGIINLTTANFTIDDNAPILSIHTPDLSTSELQYQALVFAQTNLSNTLHTLNINVTGSASVYVNFDYAVYTQDNIVPPTSSESASATTSTSQQSLTSDAGPNKTVATRAKTPVKAIIGGTVAGIVIFVIVIVLTSSGKSWRPSTGSGRGSPVSAPQGRTPTSGS